MNILGLDTSTPASAAAVLRVDGATFTEDPAPARLDEPPAHARELLPAAERALRSAELTWTDLDAIAVGTGPGAFTGLRIGVATARGLAAAHRTELRPVSSLAALADGIDAPERLALIDARRGELFAGLYDDEGTEIWPATLTTATPLAERLEAEGRTPLCAGNGSVRFREALEAGGVLLAPAGSQAHVVSAASVCRLALKMAPEPIAAVTPQYVREPDAQPQ